MDEQVVAASRQLSCVDLNVDSENIPLTHYWCRIAFQRYDRTNLREHCHSFFELHLCLTGECVLAASGVQVTLTPHTFLLLPPQKKHTIIRQSENFSKFVWGFMVRNDAVAQQLCTSCENTALHRADDSFLHALQIILDNSSGNEFASYHMIKGQLYYMFILLVRSLTALKAVEQYPKNTSAQLAEIQKYISDNLSVNLSVMEIADQFYLSRKQLTRICMDECKMTVNQLKHRLQTERMSQMLIQTDATLEEIAQATGFADKYSMSKFFHKQVGMPPVKYRKAAKQ